MYPIEKYNFVTYDKKNKDGSITKVTVAMSTYSGRLVKGVAKCMATDSYDPELGKKLAAARCDAKVCKKRKTRAEEKYGEARKSLENLENYVRKVGNYYSDARNEYYESLNRLKELEKELM
jgi:hypothetical protein